MSEPEPKLVLCHGTFDLLHPGHLEHLSQARSLGDHLVVGVTADAYVNKGPGRPVFTDVQRAEMLVALKLVDEAVIVFGPSALPLIHSLKPKIYCKGPDYSNGSDPAGNLAAERAAVESYGGTLVFTTGEKLSSTAILAGIEAARHEPIPEAVQAYLGRLRAQYCADDVLRWLEAASNLSAQTIGEVIMDEYVYVTPAGRSAKENTICYVPDLSEESRVAAYRGGVGAVSQHLAALVKTVTEVGYQAGPIIKRRYVQRPFLTKVFSVVPSITRVNPLPTSIFDDYSPADLTVIADYGHGLIDQRMARDLTRWCRFLALTVQANSLNWGFNLLTKYPGAHYVVVDEAELRLACCDTEGDIRDLVLYHATRMGCHQFAVTLGHRGCLVYDGSGFAEAPALATRVLDRMGAGDAYLSWTAPLVKVGAPKELIGFVGNVAAGIKVGMVGNQVVTRGMIEATVRGLLA